MPDSEAGYKWWVRYVVVPLIGGGGLIALFVAYLNRPPALATSATVAAPATASPSLLPGAPTSSKGKLDVHIPSDVAQMWVFYQWRDSQKCERPVAANPIKPSEVVRRMPEFIETASKRNVRLIFVAQSTNGDYVTPAEDIRINGRALKRNVKQYCDPGGRDGYELVLPP